GTGCLCAHHKRLILRTGVLAPVARPETWPNFQAVISQATACLWPSPGRGWYLERVAHSGGCSCSKLGGGPFYGGVLRHSPGAVPEAGQCSGQSRDYPGRTAGNDPKPGPAGSPPRDLPQDPAHHG